MIKVEKDPNLENAETENSLEVVGTRYPTFDFFFPMLFFFSFAMVLEFNVIFFPIGHMIGFIYIPLHRYCIVLGTTTLHNGMILSTLSINSHGFAFGFPKGPHTYRDVFLTYKLMIIPLISQCGNPSQQSSIIFHSNKVHHRASPKAYGALEQPPLNRDSTPFSSALKQSTPFV